MQEVQIFKPRALIQGEASGTASQAQPQEDFKQGLQAGLHFGLVSTLVTYRAEGSRTHRLDTCLNIQNPTFLHMIVGALLEPPLFIVKE